MKLTYIFHSGFALEFSEYSIIIDYYEDTKGKDTGYVHDYLLKKESPLYILSTHSHFDHFNPEILEWKKLKDNIIYIFSKDILNENKAGQTDAIHLDKLETYSDKNIDIKAYGSTDIGVSYYIKADNKKLFHAGDLNNWHWNEESTEKEIKQAEDFYLQELNLVSSDIKYLDLAMFPLDPRLGKNFMKGAEQFIEAINVKIFVPMHFSSNPDKISAFEPIAKKHNSEYICWKNNGESITI